MTKEKTCWTCRFREIDLSIPPCDTCELHFNWETRDYV